MHVREKRAGWAGHRMQPTRRKRIPQFQLKEEEREEKQI